MNSSVAARLPGLGLFFQLDLAPSFQLRRFELACVGLLCEGVEVGEGHHVPSSHLGEVAYAALVLSVLVEGDVALEGLDGDCPISAIRRSGTQPSLRSCETAPFCAES